LGLGVFSGGSDRHESRAAPDVAGQGTASNRLLISGSGVQVPPRELDAARLWRRSFGVAAFALGDLLGDHRRDRRLRAGKLTRHPARPRRRRASWRGQPGGNLQGRERATGRSCEGTPHCRTSGSTEDQIGRLPLPLPCLRPLDGRTTRSRPTRPDQGDRLKVWHPQHLKPRDPALWRQVVSRDRGRSNQDR